VISADGSSLELVSFDDPPVQEVVLSVQFPDPVLDLDGLSHLGNGLRKEYPVRQFQQTLPRMVDPAQGVSPQINLSFAAVLPRVWFMSQDGRFVVQAQEDRVTLNWRKTGPDSVYPRYPEVRERFREVLRQTLEAFGEQEGSVRFDFCELAYVNELAWGDSGSTTHPRVEEGLRPLQAIPDADFLPAPEDSRWASSWGIRADPSGEKEGTLIVVADPSIRGADNRHVYLLTMTGSMPGEGVGVSLALQRLDAAHEWVVRGFEDLTTEMLHDQWRKSS